MKEINDNKWGNIWKKVKKSKFHQNFFEDLLGLLVLLIGGSLFGLAIFQPFPHVIVSLGPDGSGHAFLVVDSVFISGDAPIVHVGSPIVIVSLGRTVPVTLSSSSTASSSAVTPPSFTHVFNLVIRRCGRDCGPTLNTLAWEFKCVANRFEHDRHHGVFGLLDLRGAARRDKNVV
jgi:hypothetical protein